MSKSKIQISEPNKYDEHGWAPLHLFAASGNDNLIDRFVKAGADVNSIIITDEPNMSVSPLVLAIRGGHTSTVSLLVSLGADINLSDKDGMTPIFYAIQHPEKALELTQGLLEQGADASVLAQVISNYGDAILLQLGVQENLVEGMAKIIKQHEVAEQASVSEGETIQLEVGGSELSLQVNEDFKDPEVECLGVFERQDSDL